VPDFPRAVGRSVVRRVRVLAVGPTAHPLAALAPRVWVHILHTKPRPTKSIAKLMDPIHEFPGSLPA
jgi:hypothetical protein